MRGLRQQKSPYFCHEENSIYPAASVGHSIDVSLKNKKQAPAYKYWS